MARFAKRAINKFICSTVLLLVVSIFVKHSEHVHSSNTWLDEVDGDDLAYTVDESNILIKEKLTEIRSDHSGTRDRHRREVINGSRIKSISDYPYIVSLLNRNSQNQTWHTCGGTLIARNIVLSAAHCRNHVKIAQIGNQTTDHIQRRLQLTDYAFKDQHTSSFLREWEDTRYRCRKTLELDDSAFTIHKGYNPLTGENDFMLIRLSESFDDIPFPKLNSKANVPNAYASAKENRVVVSGWGITQAGDFTSASEVLQKATLRYVNNYQCGFAYGVQNIKANMLCAHSSKGRDACQGDSGGPLFMQDDDNPADDLLVGVVSWGATCGSSVYPGVYARVSSAYKWINKLTCGRLSPESCDEKGRIRAFISTEPSLPPTLSPTQPPQVNHWSEAEGAECIDYPGEFYTTSKRVRTRDCPWVSEASMNAIRWYRCYHFAYYCPITCGTCP